MFPVERSLAVPAKILVASVAEHSVTALYSLYVSLTVVTFLYDVECTCLGELDIHLLSAGKALMGDNPAVWADLSFALDTG
jgi:hypothetical protein